MVFTPSIGFIWELILLQIFFQARGESIIFRLCINDFRYRFTHICSTLL